MEKENFKILVVDDETALRSILKEILKEMDYKVVLAEDVYHAL